MNIYRVKSYWSHLSKYSPDQITKIINGRTGNHALQWLGNNGPSPTISSISQTRTRTPRLEVAAFPLANQLHKCNKPRCGGLLFLTAVPHVVYLYEHDTQSWQTFVVPTPVLSVCVQRNKKISLENLRKLISHTSQI